MIFAALIVATLVLQRFLGWPGFPDWLTAFLVPMACIVAPQMLHHVRSWVWLGVILGLAWDLIMIESVIGPGGIAWSAAAVAVGALTGVIADRRPRTWAVMGAIGAVVVVVVRALALKPLGLESDLSALMVLETALLTGLWCGLVGWFVLIDVPSLWRRHRGRRLR